MVQKHFNKTISEVLQALRNLDDRQYLCPFVFKLIVLGLRMCSFLLGIQCEDAWELCLEIVKIGDLGVGLHAMWWLRVQSGDVMVYVSCIHRYFEILSKFWFSGEITLLCCSLLFWELIFSIFFHLFRAHRSWAGEVFNKMWCTKLSFSSFDACECEYDWCDMLSARLFARFVEECFPWIPSK